jgi:hypothetical protein
MKARGKAEDFHNFSPPLNGGKLLVSPPFASLLGNRLPLPID